MAKAWVLQCTSSVLPNSHLTWSHHDNLLLSLFGRQESDSGKRERNLSPITHIPCSSTTGVGGSQPPPPPRRLGLPDYKISLWHYSHSHLASQQGCVKTPSKQWWVCRNEYSYTNRVLTSVTSLEVSCCDHRSENGLKYRLGRWFSS